MNKEYFNVDNDPKFLYQMLSRLEADCKYFLGNGNGAEKYLWALTVDEQILAMKEIYEKIKEKPEWITLEQINDYEKKMKAKINEKSLNSEKMNYKNSFIKEVKMGTETEKVFSRIYQELKEEMSKNNGDIFVKKYNIPSINYNSASKEKENMYFASGIEMELYQMMKQFDGKVFFYSYKDKYFFSNNEEKAKETMLKEIQKETLKEQREGRLKRRNRDVR